MTSTESSLPDIQSRRRRRIVAISMGILFLLIAFLVWVNGFFHAGVVFGIIDTSQTYGFALNQPCTRGYGPMVFFIFVIWSVMLLVSALYPPYMMNVGKPKRNVLLAMFVGALVSISTYWMVLRLMLRNCT